MAKYIEFHMVSDGGKVSPKKYGYHVISIYEMKQLYAAEKKWIEDNINGWWSWCPISNGINFYFFEEIDAMAFKLRWL